MENEIPIAVAKLKSERDYPNQLLQTASEMIAKERYETTIVIAQMACEISVERVFSAYFKARNITFLEEPIEDLISSFNLGNDKVRKLYVALTDDNIQREFFWQEYKTVVKLRNKAVHGGNRIELSQAQMTLRVATSVVKHLTKIEKSAVKITIDT